MAKRTTTIMIRQGVRAVRIIEEEHPGGTTRTYEQKDRKGNWVPQEDGIFMEET